MSYTTIHQCANDEAFQGRLMACAAQEGSDNPEYAMSQLRWQVASASDIEAAYAYAIDAGNENPGGDASVITDQQILSAVQAILKPPVEEPPVQEPAVEEQPAP